MFAAIKNLMIRRRASRALVESAAADLIARFGAAAYLETRLRQS